MFLVVLTVIILVERNVFVWQKIGNATAAILFRHLANIYRHNIFLPTHARAISSLRHKCSLALPILSGLLFEKNLQAFCVVKGRIVRRHLFGLSIFKAGPSGSYYSSHFFDLTLLSLWGECSYWLNSTWHLLSPSNQTPYSLFLCYIPQGNMLQADFSSPADWIKSFPFKPRVDSGLHWEGPHCKVYVWQRMRGSLGNLWVRPSVPSTSEWLCALSLIDRHMHKIYVTEACIYILIKRPMLKH